MNASELEAEIKVAPAARDRRRPGRRAEVSPALLSLLRRDERKALAPLELAIGVDEAIGLRAMQERPSDGRGIILAFIMGVALWAALIAAGAALFKAFG